MGKEQIRVVSEVLYDLIDQELSNLIKKSEANCALVVDKSGYTIASKGHVPGFKEDMGALSAGIFAAFKALMNIGSSKTMTVNFYSAKVNKLHFSMLGPGAFLLVLYSSNARDDKIAKAAAQFGSRVKALMDRDETKAEPLDSLSFIEQKIDQILKNP